MKSDLGRNDYELLTIHINVIDETHTHIFVYGDHASRNFVIWMKIDELLHNLMLIIE